MPDMLGLRVLCQLKVKVIGGLSTTINVLVPNGYPMEGYWAVF